MRNIFLEKFWYVCVLYKGSFPKNQNWWYLSIDSLKFYTGSFLCFKVDGYWVILELRCRLLAFTSYNAFFKTKKNSGTSLPSSFSAGFLKKNISHVTCFIDCPSVIVWLPLVFEILDHVSIPGFDAITFGN